VKFKDQSELPEGGGSKNFLKLKDKESVQGIFRGDLHELFVLWKMASHEKLMPATQALNLDSGLIL
jgi:hypothetical protein